MRRSRTPASIGMIEGPLLKGLPRRVIDAFLQAGKEVPHARGDAIVREGEPDGIGFHLILDGRASVVVGTQEIATLGPGEFFGEMALIDRRARSATVLAATPLRTFTIPSWAFSGLLRNHPIVAERMLETMSRRLRSATHGDA